ncbi:type IV pilus modification PilV family protein [Zemynaea arenosa]|nr:prepilin-type N-terminal cleavage/methylation domain-containing protein [Massilia arenosa]
MCTDRSDHPRALRRQRGLTMIELVLFIVIVSVGVAGILGAMSVATTKGSDPVRRKQAIMIAEQLMEEVQGAGYTLCDPTDPGFDTATVDAAGVITGCVNGPETFGREGTITRPYDNVNDYVAAAGDALPGFDSGGVLANAAGKPLTAGYTATVRMVQESFGNPAVPNFGAIKITITVSYDQESFVLDGYRTRYAPNQR